MRERLVNLRSRRDKRIEPDSRPDLLLAMTVPVVTPAKIEKLALLLRQELHNGSPDLRAAYARLLLNTSAG
jgi:hypothetical protein